MRLLIHIDGASRGNPGPAAVGVLIEDERGNALREHGRAIGKATNNVAEYTALLDALHLARELGGAELEILSDSQLLVRQFNGLYRVKDARLLRFLSQAQALRRDFRAVELRHVSREQNRRADALANAALDRGR